MTHVAPAFPETPVPLLDSEEAGGSRAGAAGWLLLSPLLLWLAAFVIIPTVLLCAYSVYRYGGIGQVEPGFTLSNYRRAFGPVYRHIFARSVGYAGLTTIVCLVIGYPVAYFIGRSPPARRGRLLLLVMIPFWTSFLIRAYAWFAILRREGILNGLLHATGVIPGILKSPVELLYTPWAVLIALVYTYLPFTILPIYGSVEKLDESLLEAAADLGAGPAQAFWRVILPLTWPGVVAGFLLVFVPAIAMFAVTSLMSGGKVRLIGDEIQDQFLQTGDSPFGAALGTVLLVLFLLSFGISTMKRNPVRRNRI